MANLWCSLAAFCGMVLLFVPSKSETIVNTCNSTMDHTMGKVDNKTIGANSLCSWNIVPNKATNSTMVHIFMEHLLLDDGDVVEVRNFDSPDVIGSYHGQNDAFILLTGEQNVTVQLKTSSTDMKRHFAFAFHTADCDFSVDDDIPTVSEPVSPNKNYAEVVDCKYTYNIVHGHSDVKHAYVFEEFSINPTSSIAGKNVEPAISQANPANCFSTKETVEFEIKFPPNTSNHFRLRRHVVNSACSGFFIVNNTEFALQSPIEPKLDNDSVIGECRWILKNAIDGESLRLNFTQLQLTHPFDVLAITDGPDFDAMPFLQMTSTSQDISRVVTTSSSYMIVSFKSDVFSSKFAANVYGNGKGRRLLKNGSFSLADSDSAVFMLEVNRGDALVLEFLKSNFTSPAVLDIYNDFSTNSKRIASLHQNIRYPIVSKTSKMMLVASHFGSGTFESVFLGAPLQTPGSACGTVKTKISDKVENKTLIGGLSCYWDIEPINATSTSLFIEHLLLEDGDTLEILLWNTTQVLMGPYHGQNDAFILLPGEKFFRVQLNTSKVVMMRHIAFSYHAHDCIFPVDPDVSVVAEPIASKNYTGDIDCTYNYNLVKLRADVRHVYSFKEFNISSASSVSGKNVEPPVQTTKPVDMFSTSLNAEFDIKLAPNTANHFRLEREEVNTACSGYFGAVSKVIISTPAAPKQDNGTVLGKCRWLLKNGNDKNALGLTFTKLNLTNPFDVISLTDGPHIDTPPFLQITSSSNINGRVITTSSPYMMISFNSPMFASHFEADVHDNGPGKYLLGNGTFSLKGADTATFLLQVNNGESVYLSFKTSTFNATGVIDVYEDFNTNSRKIASLHQSVWYPIISNTAKIMLIASGFASSQFEAEFKGFAAGCNRMTTSDSDRYILPKNCNTTCSWIIPPVSSVADNENLILDLQHIGLNVNDKIDIIKLDDKSQIATITYNMTRFPQISLKASEGVFVNVTQAACAEKSLDNALVGLLNYLPGCSKNYSLNLYDKLEVTSPNFPDTYPVLADCLYDVKTTGKPLVHVTFKSVDFVSQHHLNVSIVDDKVTQSSIVTGTKLPNDIFGYGNALFHFDSIDVSGKEVKATAHSGQGFSLDILTTDCGSTVENATGQVTNNPNKTMCIWRINVSNNTKEAKTIDLEIEEKTKLGNYKLTIYDGASIRSGTANITANKFWSRSQTVIVIYQKLDASKPSSDIVLRYTTKECGKELCDNGVCMHPDWRCNGKDNCGDFSDEKNCGPVPYTKPNGNITPVAYGMSIIVFFAIGVGSAFLVPIVIRKCRNNQYRSFRDVSGIE